jgi:polyhydroxyalkanoate synthase subunit PhaC
MDALGLGPVATPSRVVLRRPALTLRAYGGAAHAGGRPALLIIPAPIKRAYIWDLVPWASAVQQCLRGGLGVYLIEWERPGSAGRELGLDDYAERLISDCLGAIEAETGQSRVALAGHSLGGTLAAIFAALCPERVCGLALLGAPLHFGVDAGALDRLVALAPGAEFLTLGLDEVPGSLLSLGSMLASPTSFHAERWADWLRSVNRADRHAVALHLHVVRWTLDELPWSPRLFREVVGWLYREDRFLRRRLRIGGRCADPGAVVAPLICVVDPLCPIVPPRSVLPFLHAVRSADRRLLPYRRETGVALQHVGMLVGASAHRDLWPEIVGYLGKAWECPNPR